MNDFLKKALTKISINAKKLGYTLEIHEVIDENSVVVTHKKVGKIAILGIILEDFLPTVAAYMIDIKKWAWAETEGFTKDDLADPNCLRDEVFLRTPLDELAKEMKGKA